MNTHMRQPPPHHIFVREDGRPCHIFVEATSVRERPKLVRKIIKHGGIVVNAVREAEILLAENNTKEALELLDAWRGDKIVLSTRWVSFCVDQDRFLGGNLGWAGCSLNREKLVEGISAVSDDSEESVLDAVISSKPARPMTRSEHLAKSKSDPPSRRTSGASPTKQLHRPTQKTGKVSDQSHSPSRVSRTPVAHNSSHRQNSPLPGPGPSSSQPQYPPPPSQVNSQQYQFPNVFNTPPQQQPQQQLPKFSQPLEPQFGSFPNLSQQSSYTQLNPSQLQLLQQLMMNPQLFNSQMPEQQQLNGQQHLHQAEEFGDHVERPTPEDIISSHESVSSDQDEPKMAVPRKYKGKARARSVSYDHEIQTAIRSKPILSRSVVAEERGFFSDDWGMPKKFYIMVDLKNRKDLLKIVKKHQGTIVSEMDNADYIILNNRSNQYLKVLGTIPLFKVALSPHWLEVCDSEERVVDMAPFVIDVTSGVGQGAQRKRPQPRKAETVEYKSGERIPARFEGIPVTPVKATPQQPHKSATQSMTSRSPSPPRNVVEHTGGKYLFTPEERTWFFNYVRFKLERDPDASMASLEKLIAKKAPHHSAKSWAWHWRKHWTDEMDALKKDIAQLPRQVGNTLTTPIAGVPSKAKNPSPHLSPLTFLPSGQLLNRKDDPRVLKYPAESSSPVPTPSALRPASNNAPRSQSSEQPSQARTPKAQMPPSSNGPLSQTSTQASPVRTPNVLRPSSSNGPLAHQSSQTSPGRTPNVLRPSSSDDLFLQSSSQGSPWRPLMRPSSSSGPQLQASIRTTPVRTWSDIRPPNSAPVSKVNVTASPMSTPSALPPSSAPVSQVSTLPGSMRTPPDARPLLGSGPQENTQVNPVHANVESLKRKESPMVSSSPQAENRQAKKPRTHPEEVIDVDTYLDLLPKPR